MPAVKLDQHRVDALKPTRQIVALATLRPLPPVDTLHGYRLTCAGPTFHRVGNRVRRREKDLDA